MHNVGLSWEIGVLKTDPESSLHEINHETLREEKKIPHSTV